MFPNVSKHKSLHTTSTKRTKWIRGLKKTRHFRSGPNLMKTQDLKIVELSQNSPQRYREQKVSVFIEIKLRFLLSAHANLCSTGHLRPFPSVANGACRRWCRSACSWGCYRLWWSSHPETLLLVPLAASGAAAVAVGTADQREPYRRRLRGIGKRKCLGFKLLLQGRGCVEYSIKSTHQ